MRILSCLMAFALAAPAAAADLSTSTVAAAPSALLTAAERATYRTAFAAIHGGDWAGASAALDALPGGTLTAVARAELFLARGARAPDPAAVAALLAAAPELPEAPALAKLARARGAADLPMLPPARDLVRLAGASKRLNARPNRDAAATTLAVQIQPLLKLNDASSAEPLVEGVASQLSPESLSEWRQRIAWAYLLANDDADARRVATLARAASGEWAVQADWVLGLAAWRAGDMAAAADAFAAVAARARDPEMLAAGFYWAARSDTAGGHPERVAPRLRSAARLDETFYGMLAAGVLGLPTDRAVEPDDRVAALSQAPNLRVAAALAEVGESGLADRFLRHQARIGDPVQHGALIRLAARLDLPATQIWLAQNGPAGLRTPAAARYPIPGWMPAGGWRIDRALCLAHALQESQFRTDAVSRAGARGLMQLMPGTVALVARHKGDAPGLGDRLGEPAVSFEYGQSYLEELADNAGTQGLLPKVIAAYNAGPNNVAAWSTRPGASADPLFFIETIPFAETRGYVATVLRNYWMYQRETGAPTESLVALAQGKWPRFPTTSARRIALRAPMSASTTGTD